MKCGVLSEVCFYFNLVNTANLFFSDAFPIFHIGILVLELFVDLFVSEL